MFGDTVKDPSSTRIDVGDHFNSVQNGSPFYGGTSTGSSNTYTLGFSEAPIAKVTGQKYYFIADKTNSGACTLTWGAITDDLKDATGQLALPANVIRAGDLCEVFYDGTVFRLISATNLLNQLGNGWVPFTTALTYVSSTTFTISGDWTGIIAKGDKLWLTNSGNKLGYVRAVSFGAGVTTITFYAGDVSTLANASITGYYSKAVSPAGFPQTFTWTPPSYVGFSGTPTSVARFQMIADRIFISCVTSGTSNGTSFTVGLDIQAANYTGNSWLSWGTGSDNGAYQNNVLTTISPAGTGMALNPQGGSANWTNSGTKSANINTSYIII